MAWTNAAHVIQFHGSGEVMQVISSFTLQSLQVRSKHDEARALRGWVARILEYLARYRDTKLRTKATSAQRWYSCDARKCEDGRGTSCGHSLL